MGGSGRSLSMRGPFGLNGFESMREPFGLNGFECSWVLLGAPGVLLDALGKLLDAPGGLMGVRGCSWGGAPGVLLGAPGDPYKRRRVVTGQKVQ